MADLAKQTSEAFGDIEFEYNLKELLDKDPVAALGFDPAKAKFTAPQGYNNAHYLHKDKYTKDGKLLGKKDDVVYGPDFGASKDTIVHEFRHRGNRLLRQAYFKDPETFTQKYGQDVVDFLVGEFDEAKGKMYLGDRNEEFRTELGDNLEATFNRPRPDTAKLAANLLGEESKTFSQEELEQMGTKFYLQNFDKFKGKMSDATELVTKEDQEKYKGILAKVRQAASDLIEERRGYNEGGMPSYRTAITPPAQYRNMLGDRTKKSLSVKGAEIGVEFTPVGTIFGLNDIKNELQKENPDYYKIGMMAGVEAIGLIPGLDKVAVEAIRAGAKKVGLDKVADQTDALLGGPKPNPELDIFGGANAENPPNMRDYGGIESSFENEADFKTQMDLGIDFEDDPSGSMVRMMDEIERNPSAYPKTLQEIKLGKWFRGRDNMMRFEIDDSKSSVKNMDIITDMDEYDMDAYISGSDFKSSNVFPDSSIQGMPGEKAFTTLEDIFKHDELYRKYPEIRNAPVINDVEYFDANPTVSGYFNPDSGTIAVNPKLITDPQELRSTLLHEIQHLVQHLEGFETGTNRRSGEVYQIKTAINNSAAAKKAREDYKKDIEVFDAALPKVYEELADKNAEVARKILDIALDKVEKDTGVSAADIVEGLSENKRLSAIIKEKTGKSYLDFNINSLFYAAEKRAYPYRSSFMTTRFSDDIADDTNYDSRYTEYLGYLSDEDRLDALEGIVRRSGFTIQEALKKYDTPDGQFASEFLKTFGYPIGELKKQSFSSIGDNAIKTARFYGLDVPEKPVKPMQFGDHLVYTLKRGETEARLVSARKDIPGSERSPENVFDQEDTPPESQWGEPELRRVREGKDVITGYRKKPSTEEPRQFAEGGAVGNMNRQMELFARGGLKDDGMDMDPVSGNEVPSGSLAEEVRDDIPAQLSEGEYVVPADVVRYYGVKHFEDLRNKAKKGLTQMEADGRIGGEPVMDEDITEEDIAAFERMLAIGAAEGGLMDKMAKAVKSNKMINDRANAKGMRVGYAAGGLTEATYGDPTRIDQVIDKVMGAARKDPNIMQELTKRGIEVSRTTPQMNPQEMDKANPMPETRKAFFQGGVTGLPMTPYQQPVGITPGMSQDEIYKYITTPTTVDPMYSVPGGSYIGAGVPVATPVTTETPTATSAGVASPEYCASLGMRYDAQNNMCVPRSDDDDGPTPTPEPADRMANAEYLNENLNFSDPESIEEWAKGLSEPMKGEKLVQGIGAMMPGPLGLVAAAVPSIDALKDISDLRAAQIIAEARGDTELAKTLGGYVEDRLKSSSKMVDMLDDIVATGKRKADDYAKFLGFEDLEDMSKPENKERLQARTRKYTVTDMKQDKAERERIQAMSTKQAEAAGIYTGARGTSSSSNNNDDYDHFAQFAPAATGTATIVDSDGGSRTVATYDPDKVKEEAKKGAPGGRARGGLMQKRK